MLQELEENIYLFNIAIRLHFKKNISAYKIILCY